MGSRFVTTDVYQTNMIYIVILFLPKIYVGKVVAILDKESQKINNILTSDYEFAELVRLVKDKPVYVL